MAIRQEEYQILARGSFKFGQLTLYADSKSDYFMANPLIKVEGGKGCNHQKIESLSEDKEDKGVWELVFASNSIDKTRAKYKELLQNIGQTYLKVERKIPKDILVTPYE